MSIRRITGNVYELNLGKSNAFLIDDEKLTLIDTGEPDSTGLILELLQSIGRGPDDLKNILLTHSHPDHSGSAADLKAITGAKVYMHAAEKKWVEAGFVPKPEQPYFTGMVNRLIYRMFIRNAPGSITPCRIDHLVEDGDWLPVGGGIQAVHVPGHSEGQLAFFFPGAKNVLFAADTCDNLFGLGYSTFYEDFPTGERSLEKLATFDFDVACFGHGKSIMRGAGEKFSRKFIGHHHHSGGHAHPKATAVTGEGKEKVREPQTKI
ncbi:MBL fold metallo-hydrolase [Chitinophaga deserti]|uniref:MBL fold metallo-hydrolase n=1 Tax=Chitinophaga deserti TaxID=2164099 RepID=UPI000D6D29A9|nr:MBL fold metallo-hydrolase [Chitinophaga deserti]